MNDWFGYMPPGMGPMESGGAGSPMPQSGRAPRFGGVLQRVGRALTPERLQGLAAILQDLNGGQGHFDRFQAGQAEHRQQAAEQERQARFREAYAASVGPDGQIDPALLQRNLAPFVSDIGDVAAVNGLGPKPERIMTGADLNGDGAPDFAYESTIRNALDGRTPIPGQAAMQSPAVGQRAVNRNDPNAPALVWNGQAWVAEGSARPTEAAPTGAATPQGQRFGSYDEIGSFLAEFSPGSRITSMGRSQAVQDDLYNRGKTPTRNSTHVNGRGLGTDYVPRLPFDQWEQEAARLRATGRFRNVRIETGRGRNQGTGPHIHLEPVR